MANLNDNAGVHSEASPPYRVERPLPDRETLGKRIDEQQQALYRVGSLLRAAIVFAEEQFGAEEALDLTNTLDIAAQMVAKVSDYGIDPVLLLAPEKAQEVAHG